MFHPELAEAASSPSVVPPDLSHQREKNQGLCSGHGLLPPLPPCAHGLSIRKVGSGLRQDGHDFLKPMH